MNDETPNATPAETAATPVPAPFTMVGDAEAPVCVDGVCEVPAEAVDHVPGEGATPARRESS